MTTNYVHFSRKGSALESLMENKDNQEATMKKSMDAVMIARIDAILEKVKDPESGLSVA